MTRSSPSRSASGAALDTRSRRSHASAASPSSRCSPRHPQLRDVRRTTLEDAFADAKSDEDRVASTSSSRRSQDLQLLPRLRQYTCGNCWNERRTAASAASPTVARGAPAPFRTWSRSSPRPRSRRARTAPPPRRDGLAETDLRPRSSVASAAEAAPRARRRPEPVVAVEPEPVVAVVPVEPEPVVAADDDRSVAAAAATATLLARFRPDRTSMPRSRRTSGRTRPRDRRGRRGRHGPEVAPNRRSPGTGAEPSSRG